MYSLLFIQIQHLLKLNAQIAVPSKKAFFIQIQHLLKLNYFDEYGIEFTEDNSNTTLVKVKFKADIKERLHQQNSNTTLVKVK